MEALLYTVLKRPYVVVFLLTFLIISILNRGALRTLSMLVIGYAIAFASEYSSIRNGFPYGLYYYIYGNLRGELLLGGVPVWDSISYSFIAYASYETVSFFLKKKWVFYQPFFAAILMALMDVVIDPIALQGDRWFLGKIYGYVHDAHYFGIPITNFLGWLFVALLILYSFFLTDRFLISKKYKAPPVKAGWLGPVFFTGILFFNLGITAYLGLWRLFVIGLGLHGLCFLWLFQNRQPQSSFLEDVAGSKISE